MEFLELHWSDFKSFVGEHHLDFRKYTPGLYFIRGENRAEPELGSNGAAKSTLLDIISWVLYGTSMRGTKTPELVPWHTSDNPTASLRLRVDKKIITIRRTYKPTTLAIIRKGKETLITQEQLDDLIGLTSTTFENSIVIGQFTRLFFDLKPREKMSVFASLLDLDYWLECAENANRTLGVLEEDALEAGHKIDVITTRIDEIQRTIAGLKKEKQVSAKKIKEIITKTKNAKRDYITKKRSVEKKITKLEKLHASNQRDLKKVEKTEDKLQHEIDNIRRDLSSLSSSIQVQKTLMSEKRKQERNVKDTTGSCPACGQQISKAHRYKELKKIATAKGNIEKKLNWLEGEEEKLIAIEVEKHKAIKTARKVRERLRLELSKLSLDLKRYQYEKKDLEREINNCGDILTYQKQRKSDSTDKIKVQQKRLDKQKRIRLKHRRELKELKRSMEQVSPWIKGFKEIRLYELEETLTSLEVEINSYLVDLGMEGWTVHLDVERETKSGKISKGFQAIVDPGVGSGKKARPWEVWSGGEGQRLRLAGTLALSNLILKQFGRQSNFQAWDERLIWLSGSGREDMLELLQATAKREQKQIWIIDQNELSFPFDGVLTVVKDRNGSQLVA